MPVLALGVSHRRASVELLERLAFASEDLPKAYHGLTRTEAVRGAVILSTCNRVEVFADVEAYHSGLQAVKEFLSESRSVDPDAFGSLLDARYEEQAADHLFSVAAGLDSMVLGEPQVLSQVRQAFKAAEAEVAAGPALGEMFRRAIRVGRRARAETAIGASPSAFVEAGAVLAERALGSLEGREVLLVGAGKMSELAVRHLRKLGVGRVRVLSRTVERAERLARRAGGDAGHMAGLSEALARADLVVSATGAASIVIGGESVGEAASLRRGRPLFILDLAVPRDVDPSAAELPGVRVADIDDLRDLVDRVDEREMAKVRAIVEEEVERFTASRRAARLAPLIEALYARGERIRRAELERVRGRLAALTEEQLTAVEAATRAMMAKLLHGPVVRAKELDESGDARARLLAELFDLELPAE